MQMFIAALFIIAQNLEVTKRFATYEWIYTMYIHTMEYYLVIKRIKKWLT